MNSYDKTTIKINGKEYYLVYAKEDGRGDFVGYGFKLYDPHSNEYKGYVRVIISYTSTAMWGNNTKYPYASREEAIDTARRAVDAVISTLNLSLDPAHFENLLYRGDEITIQINTMENAVSDQGFIVNLQAHESPEQFVSKQLFSDEMSAERIRNAILLRLNRWETLNYGLRYTTKDLAKDLFLSRNVASRNVDYLAESVPPLIAKSAAGDDEFAIKLLPAGIDQVQSLEDLSASYEKTFTATNIDQAIYSALDSIDPNLARSYEQVIKDINDPDKVSWRGTANEIREIISGLLRAKAPDKLVMKQPGYEQDPRTSGPTQAQRAKYIMQQHKAGSKQTESAKQVDLIDERVAKFIRQFYERASDGAHRSKERKEIKTLHDYLIPLLRDLLDID